MHDSRSTVTAARQMRRANAHAVLDAAWDGAPFTASDVIEATGLARSTALGLCEYLKELGWVIELSDARAAGEYRAGRPARRYAFDSSAGRVLGVDAGQNRVTATVADLGARTLGRATVALPRNTTDRAQRRRGVRTAVERALRDAGVPAEHVLAAVVGVPAPVDDRGATPHGDHGYWASMNPDLRGLVAHGSRETAIENDAKLAAVAERAVGAGTGCASFATLLAGERLGAGIVVDGRLLRGRSGGAGELRMLDLVDGVHSSVGLAGFAREMIDVSAQSGQIPADSPMLDATSGVRALFAAADGGDDAAVQIVEALVDRLARVCVVLATLLDLERVVVAGAMAEAMSGLTTDVTARLAAYAHEPLPEVVASPLAGDVVSIGAVHHAISLVRADPLRFDLPAVRR